MVTEEKLRETVERMCTIPLVRDCLALLKKKLPHNLSYHSYAHTTDVLQDALLFGLVDALSPRSLELLAIAAVMHDMGFIQTPQANEPIAAKHARGEMLKAGGYSEQEIKLVEQMILDTALVKNDGEIKQIPHTELSKYLLDADLGNFGRDDFLKKSELMRAEVGQDEASFRAQTLQLLTSHEWYTPAAKMLRQATKDANLATLRARVAASGS